LALPIPRDFGAHFADVLRSSLQAKSQGVLDSRNSSASNASFPIETIRASFPALTRAPEFIFFDNAAGAQVPQIGLDAVNHHLLECNVQRGGR